MKANHVKDLNNTSTDDLEKQMEEVSLRNILDKATVSPNPKLDTPDSYGERYAKLREEIIGEAEKVANRLQELSERYHTMSMKVRNDGVRFADTHIQELIRLDKIEEAIDGPRNKISQVP